MAYELMEPQPEGLAENETAFRLDDGALVAVAIHSGATAEGGIDLTATARAIDEDGKDELDRDETPISTAHSMGYTLDDIETFGEDALVKELVLLVLGEEPEGIRVRGKTVHPFAMSKKHRGATSLKRRRAARKKPKPDVARAFGRDKEKAPGR